MPPFEKLGAFYLGREYDLASGERLDDLVMYDARDLTTHAVCVGMTGSGKTGLCIDLLEEAAIDSVPATLLDPKGDLTNPLLPFPNLRPEDFPPWVNADAARRHGMTCGDYAHPTTHLRPPPGGHNGPGSQPRCDGSAPADPTHPLAGHVTPSASDLADLLGGLDYVNVHTTQHPAGEIRGQTGPRYGIRVYVPLVTRP